MMFSDAACGFLIASISCLKTTFPYTQIGVVFISQYSASSRLDICYLPSSPLTSVCYHCFIFDLVLCLTQSLFNVDFYKILNVYVITVFYRRLTELHLVGVAIF